MRNQEQKARNREYMKEYCSKNRERLLEEGKKRRSTEEYKSKRKEYYKNNPDKFSYDGKRKERMTRWRKNNRELVLLSRARTRAKKHGLDFNLNVEDIYIPERCPIFGTNFSGNMDSIPTCPSLDRIDNTKGYVKNNVWVISNRANRLKGDASLEELKVLVSALENAIYTNT